MTMRETRRSVTARGQQEVVGDVLQAPLQRDGQDDQRVAGDAEDDQRRQAAECPS